MNKKEEYINSINKIKVGDNLKKETLNNIKENNEKRNFKTIYKLISASTIILVVLLVTIFFVGRTNKQTESETILGIENGKLPTVGTFDNLFGLLSRRKRTRSKLLFERKQRYW